MHLHTSSEESIVDAKVSNQQPLLVDLRKVCLSFGGITVLDDVCFQVQRGAITGLIGPNGAGKTSIFNCITGLYRPNSGSVFFNGNDTSKIKPFEIARDGLARTFQNIALFNSLTVRENVMVGAQGVLRASAVSDMCQFPTSARAEIAANERAVEAMNFVGISELADSGVAELTFVTRKRIELARALAANPKLILLDEPAGGLNFDEVQGLVQLIRRLQADRGISILLIEHHMNLVMQLCDHIVVMNFGSKISEGSPQFVRECPDVIEAYLGA